MAVVRAACVFALVCYALLMLLAFRRALRRPEARYFLFYLGSLMIWQASQAAVAFTNDARVALWGYRVIMASAMWFGFFYTLFVRELLNLRSARWFISLGWLIAIAAPIYSLLGGPGMMLGVYQDPGWPLYLPEIGTVALALGAITFVYMVYSLYHLYRARATTTSAIERNRLTYLTLGAPIVILGTTANLFPELRRYPIDTAAHVINALLTAYVILRYQLLDIQLIVRKGLRYSVTTVAISGIYFLLVSLSVQVLHLVSNIQVLLLSIVMAVVAALLVEPLRDALQTRVDQHFFREKYDAARMLQRISHFSAALLDVERLAGMILDEVSNTMHVERAAIFVKDQAGGYQMVASKGLAAEEHWSLQADNPIVAYMAMHQEVFWIGDLDRVPLVHALQLEERKRWEELKPELLTPISLKGVLVGVLAVGPKLSGLDYSFDDRLTLMTLANQTAVSTENARLYADVQHQLVERQRAEARILESLHEKEVLLKEIHHRVKNNLQVVHSLLSLQGRQATDAATVELLRDSQNRIRSMALIHERLYQSDNFAEIDFGDYLPNLANHLHRSYTIEGRSISMNLACAAVRLPLDVALPCALIASELISNALKHAFVDRSEGSLCVQIHQTSDGLVKLEIADDGVGMPEALSTNGSSTLGMQLIDGLVRQLEGTLTIRRNRGAAFTISFPAYGENADAGAFPPVSALHLS